MSITFTMSPKEAAAAENSTCADDTARMPTLENELDNLMGWLCTEWGFCLASKEREKIASSERLDARQFALEILKAEGFEHPEFEANWVKRISEKFTEHFGRPTIQSIEFGP